jgi:D-amino-acid dehydrogenase
MADASEKRAIVVGAGIVGVCCGLELLARGFKVEIIDRVDPGASCSFGNAGIFAAQAVVPVAVPGILKKVPRMLVDPESPLKVRLGSLPQTLPWLVHFLRSANLAKVERSADALMALNRTSVELHQALSREAGVPDLVRPTKYLYVHRDPAQLDVATALSWRLRRERGSEIEVLDGKALRDAEPELSAEYSRGVLLGPIGYTLNPFRLTQAYAGLFRRKGGTISKAEVRGLKPDGGRVIVETSAGAREAGTVVVAAGAWSAALVKPLGLRIPLIAERGYHMTFANPGFTLNHVVSEVELQFAVTSMEMGLRVAGTEELGNADDTPDWRRAEVLAKQARRMFPRLNMAEPSQWMGPRPGTPDSIPAIGAVPGHPNILIAAGHGHLGLTGGPNTGRLVAAMAAGERLNEPMEPYAPDRFATGAAHAAAGTSTRQKSA